jgi:hypothetical protein
MSKLFNSESEKKLRPTKETRTELIGDKPETYPVWEIPLSLLRYNLTNGRIYLGVDELITEKDLEKLPLDEYNSEIEKLIWESNIEKNQETYENMRLFGQLKSGMVVEDGTIVDGNRRFTILRRLNREFPNDEKFQYYKAAVIQTDGDSKIGKKDLKKLELSIQYGQEKQLDYDVVNFAFSIHKNVTSEAFTTKEIADVLKKKQNEIKTLVNTVDLINEFLEYFNQKGNVHIIRELNLFFPMTALEGFLKQNKLVNRLTDLEINRRKELFFDFLAGGKFELPQQEMRDKLVAKIYKTPGEFEDFANKYDEKYAENVYEALHNIEPELSFIDAVKSFRATDISKEMISDYKRTIGRIDLKKEADAPIKTLKNINDDLDNIVIEPYLESHSSQAKEKLQIIKKQLKDINEKVEELTRKSNSI